MITDTLKKYLGFLGGLLGGLLEFSWAVITYFVVPVLVTEKVGPVTAVKRSAAILRAKWGESLAGEARIGLIGGLFFLLSALVFGIRRPGDGAQQGRGGAAGLGVILMAIGVFARSPSWWWCQTLSTHLPVRRLSLRHDRPGAGVARPRAGRGRVQAEVEEVT